MKFKTQYKSVKEWRNADPKNYNSAKYKDWVGKICEYYGWAFPKKRKPYRYWTKEKCLEEAKKYTTKRDWKKLSQSSYEVARQTDWYGECISHMKELVPPNGYWNNKERCIEDAKKYKRIVDWAKNGGNSAIKNAKKNGWFDECTAHMVVRKTKPHGYWNKERVLEVALTCGSKQEWSYTCLGSYTFASRKGWLNDICKHMDSQINNVYWTKERCIEDAKKYKTKNQWRLNSPISFSISNRKNSWLDECVVHMNPTKKPNGYWTKERCIEEAKKYKRINDWRKISAGSYLAAMRINILDECSKHMVRTSKPCNYWNNKERCIEEAKKYKTRGEWVKNSGGSYGSARKKGWFDECAKHMKDGRKK